MATRWTFVVLTVLMLAAIVGCGQKEQPQVATGGPAASGAAPPEVDATVTPTGGKVLMILAPEGFRDEEYMAPQMALTEAGYDVVVGSLSVGTCQGAVSTTAEATVAAADAVPTDYVAVVFVGGPGMVEHLEDESLISLAQGFNDAELVVSAICVAPAILANAGLLDGVEATVFSSEEEALKAGGATLSSAAVVVQGRIVTGSGPAASGEFGETLVEVLGAEE